MVRKQITTIKLYEDTKLQLDRFRECKNESYDEVIKKMLYVVKKARTNPELSREAVLAIDKSRKRIRENNFLSEEKARKRLGF